MVKRKVITIKYTESTDQRADILTKPIGAAGFVRHHRFPRKFPVYSVSCRCLDRAECRHIWIAFSLEGVLAQGKQGFASPSISLLQIPFGLVSRK